MIETLKIAEIGDSVISGSAGALLRRLGASVTRISTGIAPAGRTQQARLLGMLQHDKNVVRVDDPFGAIAADVCSQSDITIVDLSALPNIDRAFYKDVVRRRNASCWITVSPFGLHGPLAEYRGTELTAAAAGGMARYTRSSEGRPMKPAGFTASATAGHFAVLAGLHGLLTRQEGGSAVHMDVSVQDTVIVTGVFLELAHQLFECGGDGGAARYAAPRGLIRCVDGYIWLVVLEDHQWRGCVEAMGRPAWASNITSAADRRAKSDWIQEQVAKWAAQRTAREAADAMQRSGTPATPVNSCADLLNGAGRDVRPEFFTARDGALIPDVPFEAAPLSDVAGERSAPRRYRLVDLTQVLVGPLATSWLGAMGIDVLKVEDPERMDIYRRSGPFLRDKPGPDRSAYFSLANYSKRSHVISLQTARGRAQLTELIASADVVVHNLAKRAMTLGVTPEAVQRNPGTFLVSCSGYSSRTANGSYRAYGMNIQAAGGVVHLSRDRVGQPTNLGTSWADPLSSVWLAIMTLSQLLRPQHERRSIEVSMVEVVACEFREYFQAQSADGLEMVADESRLDHAAPHGVFRTRGDDKWLALAVESDDEWARLVRALGSPPQLERNSWEQLERRLADQDALDAAVGRVLEEHDTEDLFVTLQSAGVSCAPVWSASDLVDLSHLATRGLLQSVSHPIWGERPLVGLPWLIDAQPVPITATPLLGDDTTADRKRWWAE